MYPHPNTRHFSVIYMSEGTNLPNLTPRYITYPTPALESMKHSMTHQGWDLTFIRASSCFAPLFLSRFAILAMPMKHAD